MAAHTPGPWKAEHDWQGLIFIQSDIGRHVATLVKLASGTPGSGIPSDTHAKEQGANATLIAAAPDLRRFAQEIAALGHWEAYTAEENLELLKALQRQAQQLVAKADGAT